MFGMMSSYQRRSNSLKPYQTTESSLYIQPLSPQDISLQKKVNKIALLNLKEHDLNICACEDCIYRRQLNRGRKVTLQLSKSSSYRKQYQKPHSSVKQKDFTISYQKLADSQNKSMIVGSSNYGNSFNEERKIQLPKRQKPKDQLRFVGPTKGLSGYGQDFLAFKNNANPYVKPVQVTVPNTFKFNSKSIYQQNFEGIIKQRSQSGKIADQLRGGKLWIGDSTYRKVFVQPAQQQKIRQDASSASSRSIAQPGFKHQYQTSYRHQYMFSNRYDHHNKKATQTNPLIESLMKTLQ